MSLPLIFLGASVGALTGWSALFVARYFIDVYQTTPKKTWTQRQRVLTILGAMIFGGSLAWAANDSLTFLAVMIFFLLLLILTLVDFAVRRIPNKLILVLLIWAAIQISVFGQPSIRAALLGLLANGFFMLIIAIVGRGAMGMGDVKLEAALGAILGFPLGLYALFWGIMFGGIAALLLLVSRRAGLKSSFAYGPYLALGGLLIYLSLFQLSLWPFF